MKKTLVIFLLFIAFLIIYFLQANFFFFFSIAGIKPNLFIILILFISLFAGIKPGIGCALFFGIYLDIVLGKKLGTSTLMLTLIAILGWYFDKNFSKDSKLTIMLMVIGSTAIYEIGSYILNIVTLGSYIEVMQFIKILLVEIIYNSILTIILYPAIQTLGYKVENIFKEQKILTRYF